jgi:ferritin-like protein
MDGNLDPDTSYYYVLTAVDSLGNESNYSKEVVDDEGNEDTNFIEGRAPSRNMLRTILAIRKINP